MQYVSSVKKRLFLFAHIYDHRKIFKIESHIRLWPNTRGAKGTGDTMSSKTTEVSHLTKTLIDIILVNPRSCRKEQKRPPTGSFQTKVRLCLSVDDGRQQHIQGY